MKFTEEPRSIGHLLGQICRLHHRRAHSVFEAIGLYRGQPKVLEALREEDGQTHSDLAARLHVSAATMTKQIQRMEKAGWVTRRPDPDDQRVSRVYLSEAGRQIFGEIEDRMEQLSEETFANMTMEESVLLRRLLLQVRENLLNADQTASSE
jgi:MarR family transcriptional regulator, organic hydroperoxide resistance regulator